ASASTPLEMGFAKRQDVRLAVIASLGKVGADSAVGPLTRCLRDDGYYIVAAAADALREIGDPSMADPVVRFLKTMVVHYDIYRLNAMARWQDMRKVEKLIHPMRGEKAALYAALDAIESLKRETLAPVAKVLVADMKGGDAGSSMAAIRALAYVTKLVPAPGAEPGLLKALGDKDLKPARTFTMQALGYLKSKKAVKPLAKELAALLSTDPKTDRESQSTKLALILALGEIGHPDCAAPLIAAFSDVNEIVRQTAMYSVSKVGKAAVKKLIKVLDEQDVVYIRPIPEMGYWGWSNDKNIDGGQVMRPPAFECRATYAARALGIIKDPSAVTPLINLIRSTKHELLRRDAIRSLGWIGDQKAVPQLMGMIAVADTGTANNAVWALGAVQANSAVGTLVKRLGNDGPLMAISALTDIADPAAIEPLFNRLLAMEEMSQYDRISSIDMRGRIMRTIGRLMVAGKTSPESKIYKDVRKFMLRVIATHGDKKYRVMAAGGLASMGDESAFYTAAEGATQLDEMYVRISALGRFKDPRARELLEDFIRDQQIEMRGGKLPKWDVWADVFGITDEELGIKNIGEKTHTSMTQQLLAAAALGGLGSNAGFEPAMTIVNFTGWDEWHRCTAAYALGRIGDRRALRDLEYLFL
ncbi:MAG: HEAT repeat domain-containing protein, partial [Planctomycetia bacterium]|nr:HEAT repeat domain-containing protein [Planctomycetia bacterium]